jgi:hypothetical protein
MPRLHRLLLLTLALIVAAGAACDGGGGDGGGASGIGAAGAGTVSGTGATPAMGATGGTAAGTSSTGVGTGGTGTGGVSAGTSLPPPPEETPDAGLVVLDAGSTGACDNATDAPLIESGAVDRESERCGPMCYLNGPECTVMCMTMAIDVSPECARCFADLIQCSAASCALMCFADSEGMPCRMCVDTMCGPTFDACTGRRGTM